MEDFGEDLRGVDGTVGDIVKEVSMACEVGIAHEEVEVEQCSMGAGFN